MLATAAPQATASSRTTRPPTRVSSAVATVTPSHDGVRRERLRGAAHTRGRAGLELREVGGQAAARAVLKRVNCVLGAAHAQGDLCGREARDEAKQHDAALILGQGG